MNIKGGRSIEEKTETQAYNFHLNGGECTIGKENFQENQFISYVDIYFIKCL